jgi:hypothetical protein
MRKTCAYRAGKKARLQRAFLVAFAALTDNRLITGNREN